MKNNYIKNISYTVMANGITLFIAMFSTLILPKFLGINSFGMYQIYIFFTGYVGFLHLGWCDGVYLKYGGNNFDELDMKSQKKDFNGFILSQLLIMTILLTAISFFNFGEKQVIYYFAILNIPLLNIRFYFYYILQATDKMKEYSTASILDRLLFVLLTAIYLIIGGNSFIWVLLIDIFCKIISLFYLWIVCRSFTFLKVYSLDPQLSYSFIKIGINLMIANLCSILIVGIIRFAIQNIWSIETYSLVSFSLSLTNLLMVFVSSVGIAIYPLLKKIDSSQYSIIYLNIRSCLMVVIFLGLLLYYPARFVLGIWLPDYEKSFFYMIILFPIVVFDSKVSLLTNTFLKVLRKEKAIMQVNIRSLIFSLLLVVIFAYYSKNLNFTLFSIIIVLGFRSIYSEFKIYKILNISLLKDTLLEVFLVCTFIFANLYFGIKIGFISYLVMFIIYVMYNLGTIKKSYYMFKKM